MTDDTASITEDDVSRAMWREFPPAVERDEDGEIVHKVVFAVDHFSEIQRMITDSILNSLPEEYGSFVRQRSQGIVSLSAHADQDDALRIACDVVNHVLPPKGQKSADPSEFCAYLQRGLVLGSAKVLEVAEDMSKKIDEDVILKARFYPMLSRIQVPISTMRRASVMIGSGHGIREIVNDRNATYGQAVKEMTGIVHGINDYEFAIRGIAAERMRAAFNEKPVTSFADMKALIIKRIRTWRKAAELGPDEALLNEDPEFSHQESREAYSIVVRTYLTLLLTSLVDPNNPDAEPDFSVSECFFGTFSEKHFFNPRSWDDHMLVYEGIMALAEHWREMVFVMGDDGHSVMEKAVKEANKIHGDDLLNFVRVLAGMGEDQPLDPYFHLMGQLTVNCTTMSLFDGTVSNNPSIGCVVLTGPNGKGHIVRKFPIATENLPECHLSSPRKPIQDLLFDQSYMDAQDNHSTTLNSVQESQKPKESPVELGDFAYAKAKNPEPEPQTPRQLAEQLAKRVLGQDGAVKALALHLNAHKNGKRGPLILVGPTGSGKSALMSAASKLTNRKVITINGANLVQSGVVGTTLAGSICSAALTNDISEVEKAIIFIDEFDKITTGIYAPSIIASLLKMTEGEDISSDDYQVSSLKRRDSTQKIRTHGMIWIFAGSWSRLRADANGDKIEDAVISGFHGSPCITSNGSPSKPLELRDLDIPVELRGRISAVATLNPHTVDSIMSILQANGDVSPWSVVERQVGEGVVPTDALVRKIAEKAVKSGYGVRGAQKICQQIADELVWEGCEGVREIGVEILEMIGVKS